MKYKISFFNGSKVVGKVKVVNRQTDRQTVQKQYSPDLLMQGHKNKAIKFSGRYIGFNMFKFVN